VFSVTTSGDIGLAGGAGINAYARIYGDPDVNLVVGGVIDMRSGSGAGSFAAIEAASANSINITFPNLALGGFAVNGVTGVIYDATTSTGFVAGGLPAVEGQGFNVVHSLAPQGGFATLTTAQLAGSETIVDQGSLFEPVVEEQRQDAVGMQTSTPAETGRATVPVCR